MGVWAAGFAPPKGEEAAPPVVEAPTFPKSPPLGVADPVVGVFVFEPKVLPLVPKRPPLEAPEAGVPPNEKPDIVFVDGKCAAPSKTEKTTTEGRSANPVRRYHRVKRKIAIAMQG